MRYVGVWRWGRLAVSKGGLALVGVGVAISVVGLEVALSHQPRGVAVAALLPLAFMLQLVPHELGHALVAVSRGYRVQTVFAGSHGVGVEPGRPSNDTTRLDWLLIVLAGPAANLLIAAVTYLAGDIGGWTPFLSAFLGINIFTGVANLVPLGGRKVSGRDVVVSWPMFGLHGSATDGYYAKLMFRRQPS